MLSPPDARIHPADDGEEAARAEAPVRHGRDAINAEYCLCRILRAGNSALVLEVVLGLMLVALRILLVLLPLGMSRLRVDPLVKVGVSTCPCPGPRESRRDKEFRGWQKYVEGKAP